MRFCFLFVAISIFGTQVAYGADKKGECPLALEEKKDVTRTHPLSYEMQNTSLHASNRISIPVDIYADISALPHSEVAALVQIIAASRIMDAIFLEQAWAENPSLLLTLQGHEALPLFLRNKGPWLRMEQNRPFLFGIPPKPAGAAYYPVGATRSEIDSWIKELSKKEQELATSFFTVIRRDTNGHFQAVPYSLEYQGLLTLAAQHLQAAADLTENPTLASYLRQRASAFISNDYYESDVAWLNLDSAIEPTIGPYEVYEDDWFNYKASFEAFVTIRDDTETTRLSHFGAELQNLEDNLPIDPSYRNPRLGGLAPIRVVDLIFTAGSANAGYQAAAFNLPNDVRVTRNHGAKRVMLRNVQEAKFRKILKPISDIVLSPSEHTDVSFDALFHYILMHELMHGLGPQAVVANTPATSLRQALQESYSAIEEAKADSAGLWALHFLIDKGVIGRSLERSIYTTFLASLFRSIRFGVNEAHGHGSAVQLNTLLDTGAVVIDSNGQFRVNHRRIREAITDLAGRLMTIQAEGNYPEAKRLLETLGVVRPEVQRVLDHLELAPIDIQPRYTTIPYIEALLKSHPHFGTTNQTTNM